MSNRISRLNGDHSTYDHRGKLEIDHVEVESENEDYTKWSG